MPKQPTIARASLWRVLTEAALFAGTDDSLPMLCSVRLEATGTHLIAVATDRFALGVSSAPYEGTPFAITLPMAEVKLILGACKLGFGRRTLTGDVDLRVTPKGTLLHVKLGETVITVATGSYEFPRWRQLVGGSDAHVEPAAGTFKVNPRFLARLAKVGRDAKFYRRGPRLPIMARVGDHFIAAIMPMHETGAGNPLVWELPEWLDIPAAASKAVAA